MGLRKTVGWYLNHEDRLVGIEVKHSREWITKNYVHRKSH